MLQSRAVEEVKVTELVGGNSGRARGRTREWSVAESR